MKIGDNLVFSNIVNSIRENIAFKDKNGTFFDI
jgi:hypothetical protein